MQHFTFFFFFFFTTLGMLNSMNTVNKCLVSKFMDVCVKPNFFFHRL